MREKIFYFSCFGFTLGILLRSFVFVNLHLAIVLGVIAFFLFLFFSFISEYKWGIVMSIFVLAFSFGVLRFHSVDKLPPEYLRENVGEQIEINGKIIDEVEHRSSGDRFTFEVFSSKPKTRILVYMNSEEKIEYGDVLTINGKLELPQNFYTDTGKIFDYINFLRKDRVYFIMKNASAEIIDENQGNWIKKILFKGKEKFLEKTSFAIGGDENILMGGLILGERQEFSPELRQEFVDTGTIHIVALSGYNVTLVAEWIMKIFSFLSQTSSLVLGALTIFLFVIMTGGASTAIRAGIMATLALIARATGRNYDVGRALVLAGVLMILISPFILAFDVSFQLSFLATIAVIFLSPKIEKYFLWIKWKWLRDIASITTSAYIFVLQFLVYKMGNLSLVAIPANFAILPFIPLTMILGFFTGFAGFISNILSAFFGKISFFFLHYELSTIHFFSDFPFASITISNFPLLFTLAIYGYFFYRLFGRSFKKLILED